MQDDLVDPFAESVDEDDPFATSEDVARSLFIPRPPLEDLEGRLLAMVPREFTDKAPKAKQFIEPGGKEVQDRYTVDMAVLTGEPFSFTYEDKKDPANPVTVTVEVPEIPALYENVYRNEASIIGQLRKVDGSARPVLLGILRKGPQAADRDAGKTFKDIESAFAAFRRNPRGNPPRFSWQIDVDAVTAEHTIIARRWLAAAKAQGFRV